MFCETQCQTPFSQDSPWLESAYKGTRYWALLKVSKAKFARLGRWGSNIIFKIEWTESLEICQESFSIGKSEEADWIITNQQVGRSTILDTISNNHCRIFKDCSNVENPVFIEDLSSNGTFVNGELIGLNRKHILKTDDVISFIEPKLKLFKFINFYRESHGLPEEIFQQYHIGRELGAGAQGKVRLVIDRKTLKTFAVKVVKLTRQPDVADENIMTEAEIMSEMEHPNIIKYHSFIKKGNYVYMFLDYMEGGDLRHRLQRDKYLSVNTTKIFFFKLCHAVKYMHDKNYVHRDIKPDNILLESENELTELKLSDFGLSKIGLEFDTICGTRTYMAPEIRCSLKYTKKVDVWSLGNVLYFMLSGRRPFETNDDETTDDERASQPIASGKIHFGHAAFHHVPEEAKDLIRKMLTVEPNQRPTIDEVLMHPWLNDENSDRNNELNEKSDPEIAQPPSKRRRIE